MELKRYDYAVQELLREFWLYGYKGCESGATPVVGDLVMLQSAPKGPWHLSIYRERLGEDNHLLESLKTGELCKWSNVGFTVISRKWQEENPHTRWTDEQFDFERIFNAESRRAGYHWHLPFIAEFGPEIVRIGTRTRFAANGVRTLSEPMRWAGMTRADLRTAMARQVRAHKAEDDLQSAALRDKGGG